MNSIMMELNVISVVAYTGALCIVLYAAMSKRMEYYFKCLTFACFVLLVGCVGIVLGIWYMGPDTRVNDHLACMYVWLSKRFFGLEINVKGKDNIKENEQYIIVCNHQSIIDTVGMTSIWMPRSAVLGKRELAYVPLFGQYFYLGGNVLVDRQNRTKALSAMADVAKRVKNEKLNIWIFPEGTRNLNNGFLPFKKGAFHLAVEAQLPILPVVIAPQTYMRPSENIWESGVMNVTVLPPIETSGMSTADVSTILDTTRKVMFTEWRNLGGGEYVKKLKR